MPLINQEMLIAMDILSLSTCLEVLFSETPALTIIKYMR